MTTPDKAYRWCYKDPGTKILFKAAFGKIGVKNLRWTNYADIADKTPAQRDRLLRRHRARLRRPAAGAGGRTPAAAGR
jgi:hypothetical protein